MTVSPPVLKNDTSSQYPSRLHSNPGVENKGPTPSPAVSLSVHRHYQDSSNTQTLKWCSQQLGWSCCCLLQTRERAQPDWIHCSGQKHYKFGKDSMFISLCGKLHTCTFLVVMCKMSCSVPIKSPLSISVSNVLSLHC